MKLTKSQLKQLIKEELQKVLRERTLAQPPRESALDAAIRQLGAAPGEGHKVFGSASGMEHDERGHVADQYQAMASYALKGNRRALVWLQDSASFNQDAQMMLDAVYKIRPDLDPETERSAKVSPLSPEELEFELRS